MTNTASKLFVAGLLAVLPVSAEPPGKIHICVNSGNGTAMLVLAQAKELASRMFATAGVQLEWHSAGAAGCRGLPDAGAVILDLVDYTPAGQHPGALAYARVYESTHIVVLFDRVEAVAGRSREVSAILAHVMTHEITHLLEGIDRHSETGVMKAHWSTKDFDRWNATPYCLLPTTSN